MGPGSSPGPLSSVQWSSNSYSFRLLLYQLHTRPGSLTKRMRSLGAVRGFSWFGLRVTHTASAPVSRAGSCYVALPNFKRLGSRVSRLPRKKKRAGYCWTLVMRVVPSSFPDAGIVQMVRGPSEQKKTLSLLPPLQTNKAKHLPLWFLVSMECWSFPK